MVPDALTNHLQTKAPTSNPRKEGNGPYYLDAQGTSLVGHKGAVIELGSGVTGGTKWIC